MPPTLARHLSVALLCALSTPVCAAAINVVDWNPTYLLQGNGVDDPLVLFGFNPQPEPPATPAVLSHPPDPGAPATRLTIGGAETGDMFRVVLGIQPGSGVAAGAGRLSLAPGTLTDEPAGTQFAFDLLDALGALAYTAELTLTTSSGGVPIDWVSFNPQPEPPPLEGAVAFGADMSFSSFSDVTATLVLKDGTGTAITLTQVDAPPGTWLLLLGLVALAAARRYQPMP